MNICNDLCSQIAKIALKYTQIEKVILFGSRARSDNTPTSDIDLALFLQSPDTLSVALFTDEIEQLDTLLKFDIIEVNDDLKPEMVLSIQKDGVIIMDKLNHKLTDFSRALQRLSEAISEFEQSKSSTVRDGAIQRFEFTTELAWKTTKAYLINEGFTDLNSPKAVIKQAFAIGIITDEKKWIQLLNDRNTTSHIYKEELADEIFQRISTEHFSEFEKLLQRVG
ncbi:MAG: HI0074 family nucleotidyltransferase substrate-binding subunit, partial [Treponemataceae bacterium]